MKEMEDPSRWKLLELEEKFREIADSNQVPVAKLGLFATAAMTHLTDHQNDSTSVAESFLKTGDLHDDKSWYSRVARMFTATLDEAQRAGTIREVDTRKVGRIFLDSVLSMMIYRSGSITRDQIENDVRNLMDLYLNGLMIRY